MRKNLNPISKNTPVMDAQEVWRQQAIVYALGIAPSLKAAVKQCWAGP